MTAETLAAAVTGREIDGRSDIELVDSREDLQGMTDFPGFPRGIPLGAGPADAFVCEVVGL